MGSTARILARTLGSLAVITGMLAEVASVAAATKTTRTTTAQAIWTDFAPAGSGEYGFTETATYGFDEATAVQAYGQPSSVTLTETRCSGGGSNPGQPCDDENEPGAGDPPPAPAFAVPQADRCTFWTGGELSTLTQTVTVEKRGEDGSGTWRYSWTFTWDPAGSVPGDETGSGTGAWTLTEVDSGGAAKVSFAGDVAGLSAQKTAKASGPKYSFSMLNGDGTPRITNASVSVTDASGNSSSQAAVFSVIDALDEAFSEFTIGASGELSTLMATSGSTEILTTGDARTILNSDSFLGNDDGGTKGTALAFARLDGVEVSLPEGIYSVRLSAQIKGIDGNADVSVSVTRDIRIKGLGSCAVRNDG